MKRTRKRAAKCYAVLTAPERAVLLLRARDEDREPDGEIFSTMPYEQAEELDRLLDTIAVVDNELSFAIFVVHEQVMQLDVRYGWLVTLRAWANQAENVGGVVDTYMKDDWAREEVQRLLARSPAGLDLPVDAERAVPGAVPKDPAMRETARALAIGIRDGLRARWGELTAMDLVLDGFAEMLGGADPLRRDARAMIDGTRLTATELHENMQVYCGFFELGEASEKALSAFRAVVERAVNQ